MKGSGCEQWLSDPSAQMRESRFGAVPSRNAGHSRARVGALAAQVKSLDRGGELIGALDDAAGPQLIGLEQAVRIGAGVCAEGAAEIAVGEHDAVGDRIGEPGGERVKDPYAGVGVLLFPAS